MRVALLREYGSIDDFHIVELPSPAPGPGEVVVTVKAAGVSFPDVLMAQGKYQYALPLPFTPGNEVSGIVKAVGQGVAGFRPGDAVMGRAKGRGCAEEVAISTGSLWHLPPGMDFRVAGGFGGNYVTSYLALKNRARLQRGETLLVLGAAGGVGLAAVDIGRMMGARVIACASSDEKLEACRRAGADEVINYEQPDWREQVRRLTGGRGVDVCYDPVGDRYAEPAVRSMAWDGRYLVIGFAAGQIPRIPLNLLLLKGCSVLSVMAGVQMQREPELGRRMITELLDNIAAGRLHPLVSAAYPLERTAEALKALAGRKVLGKVVIVP